LHAKGKYDMQRENGRAKRASRLPYSSNLELLENRMLLSAASSAGLSNLYATTTWRLAHQTYGAKPEGSATAPGGAVTPSEMRGAYGVNNISLPNVASANGSGETIALVDAGDDPNAYSDLEAFDSTYGLPNPNFEKINQTGGASLPASAGWEMEEALDVEWAHVMAPAANIVLVEANTASFSDLFSAINAAKSTTFDGAPVAAVSMSGGEFSGQTSYDSTFTSNPGQPVTFFASSGDNGGAILYPAAAPNVVGVGGTTLQVSSAGVYEGESAWNDSSGSLSTQESQPAYQKGVVTQSSTQRGAPDVALDADPSTGAAVYDSYDGAGTSGNWFQVGGTSLSSPMMAGIVALADQGRAANGLPNLNGATGTLPAIYAMPQSDFNDITTGGNSLSSAIAGYDLVTGRGTPIASKFVPALANVGTVTPPTPTAPTIASLSASPSPATTSQAITLTANNVADTSGTVTSVSFYRESNATSGLQTGSGGDTLIATDTSIGSSGWTATQPAGLAAGTYTFYAVATNSNGMTSNVASASDSITSPAPTAPTIASLSASPSPATTSQAITLTANNVADTNGTVTSVSFYRESNATSGLQTGSGGDTLIATDTSIGSSGWTATEPAGLAAGTYTFYAVATNSNGMTSNVATATDAVTAAAPVTLTPASYQTDVGAVGTKGTAGVGGGTYYLTGSGADIWGSADAFHYAYTSISGNGTYIARVDSVSDTNVWAKAGIMLRETLAANSRQASIFITPGEGASMQWRSSTGGGSSAITAATAGSAAIVAPYWVRLIRNGSTITTSYSANGTSWTTLGTTTIAMASNAYIGMAVCAHNNSAVCSAVFDNVSLTSSVASSVKPALTPAFTALNQTPVAFSLLNTSQFSAPGDFTWGGTLGGNSDDSQGDGGGPSQYSMWLDSLNDC
jgi:regulation of enolase protein 1 (concanavalin A-like superfamily)